MLWVTAILILIQSESLNRTGERAISFGKTVNIYSNIFMIVGILAFLALLVSLIIILT